ncbi:hypothetical protein T459_15463 [Capsicum annuum]|uniref:Uncharacterized protein n=1 Tax=Capsicum annuum TaxID=4072 RepID=A0A2G2ZKC9_CAPAN|nr:uncharacterized protein LOC107870242 [Capsicum annuum]KAF3653558.1 putative geranylgeranyl transferase type-1 subunit beta-like [Capsicum annuum]PHT82448.1 hypothetical protein T459_15463 [Capsicum annuum]
MKSLSSVGLALSVVFGCLLLALIAELYYLLWWKNRILKTNLEDGYTNSKTREFCYMFCGKSSSTTTSKSQEICSSDAQLVHEPTQIQLQVGSNVDTNSDFWFKPFGDDEFMGGFGPPRFLFTIKEETKEDLESEDGRVSNSRKRSRTRSLSDLCNSNNLSVETPFLTPLASPSCFTPPLSPIVMPTNGFSFNPFLESTSDAEFNKFIRSNSPPPTFQFLKDAEEKFSRRYVEPRPCQFLRKCTTSKESDTHLMTFSKNSSNLENDYNDDVLSFQVDQHHVQHSSSSQVLPLASSPPILKLPIQQVNQQG